MRNPENEFSFEVRREVAERAKHRCQLCGKPIHFGECHHDIPISKGGSGKIENAVFVCPKDKNVCHLILDDLAQKGIRFNEVIKSGAVIGYKGNLPRPLSYRR